MKKLSILLISLFVFGCTRIESPNSPLFEKKEATVQLASADVSNSLYQISDHFVTENKEQIALKDLRGKPVVVSMIFTSCAGACPRLVADMKNIEKAMGKDKDEVTYLLVSFDTERDSAEVLKAYAKGNELDNHWILLQGSKAAVRTLSVLLNVSYTNESSGFYTHENKISVLDKNGVLRFQQEGLGQNPEVIVGVLHQLLDS